MSLADLVDVEFLTFGISPSLFSCGASPCDPDLDLAEAQAAVPSKVNPSATIADLFATRSQHCVSPTLAQLIVALIPADEFPYEDVPIDALFRLVDDDVFPVTYTVDITANCRVDDDRVTLEIDLPDGVEPDDYDHHPLRRRRREPRPRQRGRRRRAPHAHVRALHRRAHQRHVHLLGHRRHGPRRGRHHRGGRGRRPRVRRRGDHLRRGRHRHPVGRQRRLHRRRPSPTPREPPAVTEDVLYTGHVGGTGDIDYFTICRAAGRLDDDGVPQPAPGGLRPRALRPRVGRHRERAAAQHPAEEHAAEEHPRRGRRARSRPATCWCPRRSRTCRSRTRR